MAVYDYECKKCSHRFTVHQSFEEHDQQKTVKCPECGSNSAERIISDIHLKTSKKS